MCAQLALVGRNFGKLQETAHKIKSISQNEALCIPADMNNEQDVREVMAKTILKFGKLNVLVNNAGIIEVGTIENTS